MDKNTIIGFVLIAAVLIGFSWYNRPTEEELKAQQEQVEKQKAEQQKAAEKSKPKQPSRKPHWHKPAKTLPPSFTTP